MRLVIAPRAFDDLAAAAGYVARDNPAAAGRLVDRVFEIIDLLAEGGLDGPLSKLRSGIEVRSWPVPPLRIFLTLGVNRKQAGRAIGAACWNSNESTQHAPASSDNHAC